MIWVKKTEEEWGNYVDAEGKHYVLDWCHKVYAKNNVTEESLGYKQFENLEEAVKYWNLTEYVDPQTLEMFADFKEE